MPAASPALRRVGLTLGVAAATLLSGASAADAAGVVAGPAGISYTAAAGERNALTVTFDAAASTVTFTDTGAIITGDCEALSASSVRCPATTSTSIVVDVADRGDSVVLEDFSADGPDATVDGGDGGDTITGGAAADRLTGGPGEDRLQGGLGADAIEGDDPGDPSVFDDDTVDYGDRTEPVTVTLAGGDDDGQAGESDRLSGVEDVIGGAGADTLTGDLGSNRLDGSGGDDRLDGGDGNDDAVGTDGASDELIGGAGSDTTSYAGRSDSVFVTLDDVANDGGFDHLCVRPCMPPFGEHDDVRTEHVIGGADRDVLTGNGADNRLSGGGGDDVVVGGDGADVLTGDAGTDVADYARDGHATVGVTLDGAANDGTSCRPAEADCERDNVLTENVIGTPGADTIAGDAAANWIVALGGDDLIDGGAGDDLLDGGLGADGIVGGAGQADTVTYAGRTGGVTAGLGDTSGNGEAGENDSFRSDVENLNGGSGNDRLSGSSAVNVLFAGPGDDSVGVRDSTADTANCGPGSDTATVDGSDTAQECETVDRRTPAATPTPTPTPTVTPTPTPTATPSPVARVRPKALVVRIRPLRDRSAPYTYRLSGSVVRPSGGRSTACAGGRVAAQVKVVRKTISTRRAKLRSNCTYAITLRFRDAKRLGKGRLRVTLRFLGTEQLRPLTARARFLRAG